MSDKLEPIYDGDTLSVDVVVMDTDGLTPRNLSGATIAVAAKQHGTTVNGTVTPVSLSQGAFRAEFSAGSLVFGSWTIHARIVDDQKVETVVDASIEVKRSVF